MFCSCSRDKAVVSGSMETSGEGKVYLEKIMPGAVSVTDSTSIDSSGKFRFKLSGLSTPTIYNLRSSEGHIPLLIASGEKVSVNIPGKFSGSYTVEGSEGSKRMRELRRIMSDGTRKLDSIRTLFERAESGSRAMLSAAYASQYNASRQEQIRFIVSDPGSIASLYALYQRFPSDNLTDNEKNTVYYQMVADSVGARYGSSPYLTALKGMIVSRESKQDLAAMIGEKIAGEADKYPDIEMADIYGRKHKLSSLDGKVIILDFWSSEIPGSAMNNAELKALYSEYSQRGLAIYQVSLDGLKHSWVSAVTNQKLPWISVSDLRGKISPVIGRYNIKNIPANFVINRKGEIVARDLFGESLEKKIKELIKE